jgi:hypothetical protein
MPCCPLYRPVQFVAPELPFPRTASSVEEAQRLAVVAPAFLPEPLAVRMAAKMRGALARRAPKARLSAQLHKPVMAVAEGGQAAEAALNNYRVRGGRGGSGGRSCVQARRLLFWPPGCSAVRLPATERGALRCRHDMAVRPDWMASRWSRSPGSPVTPPVLQVVSVTATLLAAEGFTPTQLRQLLVCEPEAPSEGDPDYFSKMTDAAIAAAHAAARQPSLLAFERVSPAAQAVILSVLEAKGFSKAALAGMLSTQGRKVLVEGRALGCGQALAALAGAGFGTDALRLFMTPGTPVAAMTPAEGEAMLAALRVRFRWPMPRAHTARRGHLKRRPRSAELDHHLRSCQHTPSSTAVGRSLISFSL